MKAIPTRYHGRQYRSRIEARWAAMFDLLDWPHEYEPFDMNGWIPDFIIPNKHGKSILIEIKGGGSLFEFEKYRKAIRESPQKYHLLLLTATPRIEIAESGCPEALDGIELHEWRTIFDDEDPAINYEDLTLVDGGLWVLHSTDEGKNRWGFASAQYDYSDRTFNNIYWKHTNSDGEETVKIFKQLWNQAANIVQWKAPVNYNKHLL